MNIPITSIHFNLADFYGINVGKYTSPMDGMAFYQRFP